MLPNTIIYATFAFLTVKSLPQALMRFFDSVALFVEFTLGVLFVAHVPASQFEYGVRTSHYFYGIHTLLV